MCARVFQFLIAKVPDMEAALTSQQIDDIIGKVNIRYVLSATVRFQLRKKDEYWRRDRSTGCRIKLSQ